MAFDMSPQGDYPLSTYLYDTKLGLYDFNFLQKMTVCLFVYPLYFTTQFIRSP